MGLSWLLRCQPCTAWFYSIMRTSQNSVVYVLYLSFCPSRYLSCSPSGKAIGTLLGALIQRMAGIYLQGPLKYPFVFSGFCFGFAWLCLFSNATPVDLNLSQVPPLKWPHARANHPFGQSPAHVQGICTALQQQLD